MNPELLKQELLGLFIRTIDEFLDENGLDVEYSFDQEQEDNLKKSINKLVDGEDEEYFDHFVSDMPH